MDGAHPGEVSFRTPPKEPRRGRKRLSAPFRALRVLLFAAVALALGYLLLANGFLAFGTPLLFQGTNQVNATFRRAWTVYPGTVHVRDLRVTFQDRNVQFELRLPTAELDLRLTELASRTLHATRLRGQGVRFIMRHRIEPEVKGEPWVSALPKIEGFSDPPVFEAIVPEPPVPEREYKLWTIHLEDVDVGVTEIWAQFVRYRGEAVARGAFRLRPARNLWVGPASLDIERGTLNIGADLLASSLEGRIDCVVHPFDVRIPVGREVFRYISAGLALGATGLRLEPAALFIHGSSGVRIRSVPGALRVDARFDHGVMTESSKIALEMPEISIERERWLATVVTARGTFTGSPGSGAEARAAWSSGRLKVLDSELPPLDTGVVEGFVASSSRDTAAAWEMTRAGVDVAAVRVSDLRWVNAASPKLEPRLSGGLSLGGKARYELGLLDADARLEVRGARARDGNVIMALDGALDVQLSKARVHERSGRLIARFHGKNAALSAPTAKVEASNLTLNADVASERGQARAQLLGTLGRLSAKAAELDFAADGRVELLLDSLDTESLAARGGALVALSKVSAKHGKADVQAEHFELTSAFERSARGVWNARLDTAIRGFSGHSPTLAFAAEPELTGSIAEYDPAAGTGWFEGDLKIRDFRAAGRDQSATCPVLRVSETGLHARVDLDPYGNRGIIDANMRGASFNWDDFRAGFTGEVRAHFEPRASAPGSKVDFKLRARDVRLASGPGGKVGWDANVPALGLSGVVDVDVDRKIRGIVEIQTQHAASRIGQSQLETDLTAALRLDALDVDRREGRFNGAVQLRNATVRAGGRSVNGWWADIELGSASIRAGQNLDISTLFHAKLRDATPGLVALSAEDALPSWLVSLLPLRQLRVLGSVNRRCRLTDIQFTEAEGGPLEGSGRLQSVSDEVRGAFLVKLADFGALSAGIRFDPADTQVTLLAGRSWLETRLDALDDSVRELLKKPCSQASPSECPAD